MTEHLLRAGAAEYFAVPDPTDPERMTYWRRREGQLVPWPPKARYGPRLHKVDLPALDPPELTAWVETWIAEHVTPWRTAIEENLQADPVAAAYCFAALTTRCCFCARRLADPASKTYGIGPDCRAGVPPDVLAVFADAVSRAHAAEGAET